MKFFKRQLIKKIVINLKIIYKKFGTSNLVVSIEYVIAHIDIAYNDV